MVTRHHVKRHIRRVRREAIPHRIVLILFFKFVYLAGLGFLLVFLFTTQRPQELAVFKGTPYILLLVALFFILFSIWELKALLGSWRRSFRLLAWFTLIPGILGALLAIFGEKVIFAIFTNVPEEAQGLVATYIKEKIPQIWILTIGYILISIGFFSISKKFK